MADESHGGEPTSYNLLFVCTGNTCRSPIAAAVAEAELARRGWSHVRVQSAGTAAATDASASPHAVTVVGEQGLDISGHRARALSPEQLEWADLVLAMAPSHLAAVTEFGAGHKAALISDFLEGGAAGQPVEDPFGGDVDDYRRTYEVLATAVARLLDRLEPILAP